MSRWKSRSNLVDPASCYRMKLKGRSGTCVSTYYTCTHGYGSLSSFMEAEGECCGCTYHVLSPAPICPYLHRAQMYIYSVAPEIDRIHHHHPSSSSITTFFFNNGYRIFPLRTNSLSLSYFIAISGIMEQPSNCKCFLCTVLI